MYIFKKALLKMALQSEGIFSSIGVVDSRGGFLCDTSM